MGEEDTSLPGYSSAWTARGLESGEIGESSGRGSGQSGSKVVSRFKVQIPATSFANLIVGLKKHLIRGVCSNVEGKKFRCYHCLKKLSRLD